MFFILSDHDLNGLSHISHSITVVLMIKHFNSDILPNHCVILCEDIGSIRRMFYNLVDAYTSVWH